MLWRMRKLRTNCETFHYPREVNLTAATGIFAHNWNAAKANPSSSLPGTSSKDIFAIQL